MSSKAPVDLFERAQKHIPGGVNSPVRAFKSVGGTPLFIAKGDGAQIWDEDGNQFTDFCCSWGPLIHGHNHPYVFEKIVATLQNGASFGAPTRKENELAAFMLERLPFIDKIRFTSSGTEAVMSALRLARGATGKNKILKFEGCYHGHVDALLVQAGSGLVTFGTSSSAGVPEAFANETLVLPLNDAAALTACFEAQHHDLAAVIIEPIPANNGLLLQDLTFLNLLRALCTKYGVLLIFDEVISGFRVAFGGADHGECNTRVTRSGLHHGLARLQQTASLRILDNGDGKPIFDAVKRIKKLALDEHRDMRGRQTVDTHNGGVADRGKNAVVNHAAHGPARAGRLPTPDWHALITNAYMLSFPALNRSEPRHLCGNVHIPMRKCAHNHRWQ